MCTVTTYMYGHGPTPPYNLPSGSSFLVAFQFETPLIYASGLDLIQTRPLRPALLLCGNLCDDLLW